MGTRSEALAIDQQPRAVSEKLVSMSAEQRIEWGLSHLPETHAVTTSFGMQSAVMLHLVTRVAPRIPVIFIDTGYHFTETYRFLDQLCDRLDLNLHVFSARRSAAFQEAIEGRRWEMGADALSAYNEENKIEPMKRAIADLGIGTWLSGVRKTQSDAGARAVPLTARWGCAKLHPIHDWTDRDIHQYLHRYGLPYHPLREAGYVSIGDWHSTYTLADVTEADETRFLGYFRECGLHE